MRNVLLGWIVCFFAVVLTFVLAGAIGLYAVAISP